MSQLTLNVPTITVDERAVYITAVLIGCALLSSIAFEIYRRRHNAKQLKQLGDDALKMSKAATAVVMTGISSVFTALGYLLFLAGDHVDLLSTLPFVGKHVPAVIGTGWLLYNLRLNKTYQNVANVLSKWSSGRQKQPEQNLTLDGQPPEQLQ